MLDLIQIMSKIFFETIKKLREASPYTQQQMANKLNISIKQYQNYESKTIPPHDKLHKLNEIFNYDLSKIIYQENVPRETNGIEKHFSVKDAGGMILENQIEILASTRVLLSILAEIQAPQMKEKALPTQLLSIYRTMVKDEAKQVRNELRQKSL